MDRYWSKVTPQQRNIAIGTLALLLLVHLLSPSPRLSSSSPLSALSPTELQRSPAALEYWEEELQTDEQVQAFLGELHGQRQATHDEATTTAYQRGARRNDRTHGSGAPVTLYWPEPPYFWDSYFGKGQGEHIKVEGCRIECTLVSARANETARQKDSHVIVNYNVWRGTIDGLPEKGPRTLEPWQKAALYSMEPTTYTPWHQDRLKLFDIVAGFSRFADIRYETYPRILCAGSTCLGIDQINTTADAQQWFGEAQDTSPFFNAELARKAPLPRDAGPRLATFISNCGGGARNRLITDLVKEGIVFDHFGKCKEDIFGGVKQTYADEVSAMVEGQGFAFKEQVLALYYYVLVAENTVLTDYISEKVTQGLLAGGIPIVLGAPNLGEEIQPGLTLSASPSSTIYPMFLDATRFSPAELATELRELDQSPERRMAFHAWMKALPSDEVPLVRYARRTAEHDFTVQGMMRPVCDMCEYYHERFDWKGETPERFGEAKGAR